MNLQISKEQKIFLQEARQFLDNNHPNSDRWVQKLCTTVYPELTVSLAWHKKLIPQGWVAPSWPKEYGGTGWNAVERFIWTSQCAQARVPTISPIGLSLVGPVIFHFGSSEQKIWVPQGILSSRDYWCQGFSEPDAGSDLANLKTKAILDGDEYVVSGTKIWTTHAHYANWMFALVRTKTTDRPQNGITVLLIDMKAPGVSVRPIYTMDGSHEVNQVFFDNVRVPLSCRVGSEGEGWGIAKFLLEFERGGDFVSPSLRVALCDVVEFAKKQELGGFPRGDFQLPESLAKLSMDVDVLEMLELRLISAGEGGSSPGALASMLKLRASEITQGIASAAMEIAGEQCLYDNHTKSSLGLAKDNNAEWVKTIVPRYLNSRATTIFGGTSEIQRTLIARNANLYL